MKILENQKKFISLSAKLANNLLKKKTLLNTKSKETKKRLKNSKNDSELNLDNQNKLSKLINNNFKISNSFFSLTLNNETELDNEESIIKTPHNTSQYLSNNYYENRRFDLFETCLQEQLNLNNHSFEEIHLTGGTMKEYRNNKDCNFNCAFKYELQNQLILEQNKIILTLESKLKDLNSKK